MTKSKLRQHAAITKNQKKEILREMIDFRGIFDSQDDASKKSKRRNDSYIFMNWSEANAWNWRGIWSGSSLLVDIEQKTRAPESLLPRRSRHTIFRSRVHATVFPFTISKYLWQRIINLLPKHIEINKFSINHTFSERRCYWPEIYGNVHSYSYNATHDNGNLASIARWTSWMLDDSTT